MRKTFSIYIITLLIFGCGIYFMLDYGQTIPGPALHSAGIPAHSPSASHAAPTVPPPTSAWNGLKNNLQEPFSRLFLQLIVIVLAAQLCGNLFVRLGQPAVIGEMAAGILLGPSWFGWLAPASFHFVFPESSLATLKLLSQIGVCLFMFAVGMELDVKLLRHRAQTAVVVSHVSILLPAFLGVATALFLFSSWAAPGASFTAFALFMGISMSITAFPVLARILQERGLSQTPLGVTALTCAAVDDVTAWSILALVVAIVKAEGLAETGFTILLVLLFVATMLRGVRRGLAAWLERPSNQETVPGKTTLALILAFVLTCALTTEIIGVHALFGAFLAGVVMPSRHAFREWLKVRIENFSSVFLLPLFFAFTGLRTHISLLNDASSWLICGGIIFIATLGKLGGSMVTARFTGLSWHESLALGALMNTRGLMELIVLNLGYDLGILSARAFTMLVLMALVTTFLTSPLLTLAKRWETRQRTTQ